MTTLRGHDMRWWLKALAEGVIVGLCIWFAARAHGQNTDVKIAVLENRADQIDSHLVNTDGTVQRLWTAVEGEQNAIAEMQGEERFAWGVIGLLSAGSLGLQFRKRKGE